LLLCYHCIIYYIQWRALYSQPLKARV
jgi:hypothetical protein